MTKPNVQKDLISHGESIGDIKQDIKNVNLFMFAVVVVLFVGFLTLVIGLGGMIVDHYRAKESSYRELCEKISDTNRRVDLIIQKMNDFEIRYFQNEHDRPS